MMIIPATTRQHTILLPLQRRINRSHIKIKYSNIAT
jgi:hypothetical protein